jgi:hypothetical protein
MSCVNGAVALPTRFTRRGRTCGGAQAESDVGGGLI